MEGHVAVFADVHAKPGCGHYLLDIFREAVEKNRSNDSAILYRLHVDVENSSHLVFYEIWRDSAAIDVYQSSQAFRNMVDEATPATASVNIYRLRPVTE